MDIAALLLACSLHADDGLLLSVAYVHGHGNPYAVTAIGARAFDELTDPSPSSPTAARDAVRRIVAAGDEPVFGLLPVRLGWATEFGKTLDDLFDPCIDIAVASAKLSEFDYACRSHGAPTALQRRSCTLDRYGRALGLPALRRAVLADLTLQSPFPTGPESDSTSPPALFPSPSAGLFFGIAPLDPAGSFDNDFPSLLPEESP